MGNFDFGKYCTPAQLYLILGAIGILSAFFKKFSIETLLTKALFLVIWAWVLNWLCSKGFTAISWILVLLPFILVLFMFLFSSCRICMSVVFIRVFIMMKTIYFQVLITLMMKLKSILTQSTWINSFLILLLFSIYILYPHQRNNLF